MNRVLEKFPLSSEVEFKEQLLDWAGQFEETVWLDSNGHQDEYGRFEALLAVSTHTSLSSFSDNSFDELAEFIDKTEDWVFGFLSYDLKNELEALHSENLDSLGLPQLHFFQPRKIIMVKGQEAHFLYLPRYASEIQRDFDQISLYKSPTAPMSFQKAKVRLRMSKDTYYNKAHRMLDHIHRGDIYEANLCQEFYVENMDLNVLETFKKLNRLSKPPFAALLKLGVHHLISASPERYLQKQKDRVLSQPIKGTAPRSKDPEKDVTLRNALRLDTKERSENIMIVDLVRNDLSKSATRGSVTVEKLCAVESYEQVHHMVSTISARVAKTKNPVELIKETFPMGSMTGAPKIAAMKFIEELEESKRGLYSGAVGYIDPQGNFDFNVVIRSILYNSTTKYVSFSVGSAITAKSRPEREYQECLLKAKALREVLEN